LITVRAEARNVHDHRDREPKGRGRPVGSRNKPGHRAGRPRKPPEQFAPSVWEHGKAEIAVLQKQFDEAMERNSSHCAIAFAIRDAIPDARHIAVDLQFGGPILSGQLDIVS
jgi:hypothetical protein